MAPPARSAPRPPGTLADGVMEAGWLVVAAGLPAALHGADPDLYESPKLWLLQVCAASMAAAAVARIREGGWQPAWRADRIAVWTVAAALAYAAWSLASLGFALAPIPSLFGVPSRGQGVLADLAYVTLLVVVAVFLRAPAQARRLVSALLLGSVPVCALGLAEALGATPFPALDPMLRAFPVRSTLGQHSFLGGYLLLVIPLAAARLLETTRRREERAPDGARRGAGAVACLGAPLAVWAALLLVAIRWWPAAWWAAVPALILFPAGLVMAPGAPAALRRVGYALLLAAQILLLALSQGRGPWVGFVVALGAALLLAPRWAPAWRRPLRAALGAYAVALAVVVVLNVPGGPLAPVKGWHPLLKRAGSIWEVAPGAPGGVRLAIWKSVPAVFLPGPEAPSYVAWPRLLTGYGRESQLHALPPVLEEALRRATYRDAEGRVIPVAVDRAHNDLMDHLVTLGLVGVGLFLALWAGLFLASARLMRSGPDRLYAGAVALGLFAHLVELQTGVAVTGTRALFWILGGLQVAMLGLPGSAAPPVGPAPPAQGVRARETAGARSGPLALAALGALVLLAPALVGPPPLRLAPMLAGVVVGIGWLAMRCRSRAAAGALLSPVGLVAGAAAGLVVVAASANFLGGVYFGAGREHALRGAWLPAAAYYEQAVRFAPWEDSYWQSLGEAHAAALARDARDPAARARLGRSRDALETAVWLNAAGAASRRTLAGLYAQAPAGLGPDALGRAEQLYGETLALRPRSAAVLAERAELALRRGSAGDAARLADAAIALDPSRWLAWAVRARAARALGRADEAGGFEEAALARVPREARPRLERYLKGPLPPSPEEAPGARK